MKTTLFAIVDRSSTPLRPTLFCKVQPRVIENGVLKTPAKQVFVTFDAAGISSPINENNPDKAVILEAMTKVYQPEYNKDPKRLVLVGPFEGATVAEARKAATLKQLELRDRTPEERAAIAEHERKEAVAELAKRDAEIAELTEKLEKASSKKKE